MPPKPLTPGMMERLALLRYAFENAVRESRQPEPLNAVSLLTFQDVVEWFLWLAAEHNGLGLKDKAMFDESLLTLKRMLDEAATPLKEYEALQRLNKSRVEFKHRATRPAASVIADYRETVARFLESTMEPAFGVTLDKISRVALVADAGVRDRLRDAEAAAEKGEAETALFESAVAFELLTRSARGVFRSDAADTARVFEQFADGNLNIDDRTARRSLEDMAKAIAKGFRAVSTELSTLRIGLDPDRLRRFTGLIPAVIQRAPNFEWVKVGSFGMRTPPELQDARECISFVVDCALGIQQLHAHLT
jgi:hypothetical protein